jgi:hypothetical protein
LPIVQIQGRRKELIPLDGSGDLSNTHFAILALWAARRHGVAADQALLASSQMFRATQHPDGGWAYLPDRPSKGSMTCIGLLGLAMGHGVAPDTVNLKPKKGDSPHANSVLHDPITKKGFNALMSSIGEPSFAPKEDFEMLDGYLLWCLERVAVLHELKTIGGKDWYGWGAQTLIHMQQPDGSWPPRANKFDITTNVQTCFALLFLKRSNLVHDLTETLRLHSGFREP